MQNTSGELTIHQILELAEALPDYETYIHDDVLMKLMLYSWDI